MRNLSSDMLQALYSEESDEAILALVTIKHPDITTPIRVTSDGVQTVSNGNTFEPFPFEFEFPDQSDESDATAKLRLDNVDRRITKSIRQIQTFPEVTTEIVRASDPDTIETAFPDFKLTNITYNKTSIEGTLTLESLISQPFSKNIFNPANFPGLF